jgi:chromate transport protein ChrA
MITLALISSIACTVLVIPYAIVFIILGLVMAISSTSQALRRVSNKLNLVIIALLLVDLPGKYIIKGG